MFMKKLVSIKKCIILVIVQQSQNGKMRYETGGVAIEELAGLKPKMCSLLVDNSSENKKVKGVNKNIVLSQK